VSESFAETEDIAPLFCHIKQLDANSNQIETLHGHVTGSMNTPRNFCRYTYLYRSRTVNTSRLRAKCGKTKRPLIYRTI
jgi:hypothetical protein